MVDMTRRVLTDCSTSWSCWQIIWLSSQYCEVWCQVAVDQRSSTNDDCNLLLLNSMNPKSQLGSYSAHVLHDGDWDSANSSVRRTWLMWTAGRWQSISPMSFSLSFHMICMDGNHRPWSFDACNRCETLLDMASEHCDGVPFVTE